MRHSEWWTRKITANTLRDTNTNAILEAGGWQVIRVWEHEDAEEAAFRIAEVVRRRQSRAKVFTARYLVSGRRHGHCRIGHS